jgi:hypothetical protein
MKEQNGIKLILAQRKKKMGISILQGKGIAC